MKHGGKEMSTVVIMLNKWILDNKYTLKMSKGVVTNFSYEGDKADPGILEE